MNKMHNIYLVGIKGVGMTALATYLKQRGKNVWGSDVPEVFPTDRILKENDISVLDGFSGSHISDDIDLVITTGAHGGLHNEEVIEAKKKSKPVMTQAEEVGHIMQAYKTSISVCGSHGKTTTSSMLAFVLRKLGLQSSHIVGAPDFSGLRGGEYAGEDYFVAEADEYVNSPGIDNTARFMFQHPTHIICTNIELDHPDVYPNLGSIEDVFKNFFDQCSQNGGWIIFNSDEENLSKIVLNYKNKLSFGTQVNSDYKISEIVSNSEKTTFKITHGTQDLGEFMLLLPGKHNVYNAASVIALCHALGLDIEHVRTALSMFTGARRRFELIFEKNSTFLFDDYAHHPTELTALIESARSKYTDKKIIIIFQPHTYSRTKELFSEFIIALSKADRSYVLDIFGSAREGEDQSISSQKLAEEAHARGFNNIEYIPQENVPLILSKELKSGDIVFTVGAGDVYLHQPDIIKIIASM
jgi:UDP-N-acetylmuramate--alanine ligase